MEPAPAITYGALTALLTTIIASWSDLSDSSINYSAPPRIIIVTTFTSLNPVKKLNLSAPIYFSSKFSQFPSTSAEISETAVIIFAPVAYYNLFKSSFSTLPALKIPLSAKNYVAKSPIDLFEKTTFAPLYYILFNLLYIIAYSASIIFLNSSGFYNRISAFSFSAYHSNSKFNNKIFGFYICFYYYSYPAYVNVFLNAIPETS